MNVRILIFFRKPSLVSRTPYCITLFLSIWNMFFEVIKNNRIFFSLMLFVLLCTTYLFSSSLIYFSFKTYRYMKGLLVPVQNIRSSHFAVRGIVYQYLYCITIRVWLISAQYFLPLLTQKRYRRKWTLRICSASTCTNNINKW